MAKIKLNSTLAIYTNSGANAVADSANKKLIISTHGGWSHGDGTFTRGQVGGVLISFYSSEDYCVTGNLSDALGGSIKTIDTPMTSIKNYELTRFEHDPKKSDLEPHLTDEFDALKVRTKFMGERSILLKDAILAVQAKGYQYSEICCLFCRYTGLDKTMDARDRTSAESERLGMLSKQSAINQELQSALAKRGKA
ncbi:putative adhesin [Niveibacterium sp. SC-1]|uniref:putative adhesin n=1 Tax=Niveibacterium sp. SC-1 TaxID=3135646 RepID=UPI00311D9DC8